MAIENTAYGSQGLPSGREGSLGQKPTSALVESTRHRIGQLSRLATRVVLPLSLLISNASDVNLSLLRPVVILATNNNTEPINGLQQIPESPKPAEPAVSDQWTVYKSTDYEIECPPMWICQNDKLQGPGIEIGIAKENTDNFGDHESLYRYLQRVYLPRLINPTIQAFPDNQPKDFSSLITIDFHTTTDRIPNSQSEMSSGKYIFIHHPDGRLFRISYQIPDNLTAETRQQMIQALGSFKVTEPKTRDQNFQIAPAIF